jgi:hypothetical protein
MATLFPASRAHVVMRLRRLKMLARLGILQENTTIKIARELADNLDKHRTTTELS